MEVLQQKLSFQSKSLTDALKVAGEAKKESVRKAGVGAAQEAQRNFQLTRELLQHAQKELDRKIKFKWYRVMRGKTGNFFVFLDYFS